MLEGIKVKSEIREPKRLTSYDENITSTRPDVSKACAGHEGNKTPNSNHDRSMFHHREDFSKGELPKRHKKNVNGSQYDGNRSRINSHHDKKNRNDDDSKENNLGWQRSGLDQRVSKTQICKDPIRSHAGLVMYPETNNVAHGGSLSLVTDDTFTKHP